MGVGGKEQGIGTNQKLVEIKMVQPPVESETVDAGKALLKSVAETAQQTPLIAENIPAVLARLIKGTAFVNATIVARTYSQFGALDSCHRDLHETIGNLVKGAYEIWIEMGVDTWAICCSKVLVAEKTTN